MAPDEEYEQGIDRWYDKILAEYARFAALLTEELRQEFADESLHTSREQSFFLECTMYIREGEKRLRRYQSGRVRLSPDLDPDKRREVIFLDKVHKEHLTGHYQGDKMYLEDLIARSRKGGAPKT